MKTIVMCKNQKPKFICKNILGRPDGWIIGHRQKKTESAIPQVLLSHSTGRIIVYKTRF